MGQKEMTVNILPTRTWNRLGMNESQIQIEWPEESVLIKPERLAAGVTWEKEISGKEWDEIQTGMGREYDAMAAECGTAGANRTDTVNGTAVTEENAGAGSIYRLTAEAAAVLQNENTEWTVLCVDYKNGSYQNRLCLDAKENSRLNVLIVFRSGEDAQGTSSFQVKVHAEKNAEALVIEEDAALGAAVIGQVHHAVAQRAPGQVADAVKGHADAHQQQRHPHTDRVHHDALGHKLDLPPVGEARGLVRRGRPIHVLVGRWGLIRHSVSFPWGHRPYWAASAGLTRMTLSRLR